MFTAKINNIHGFFFGFMLLWGCSSNDMKQIALEEAGANAPEIEKVLEHYDDERREAAEYMVETMVGRYGVNGQGLDSIEKLYAMLPQKNRSWQFDSIQLALAKKYQSLPVKKSLDLQTLSADYLIRNLDDAWKYKIIRQVWK